MKQGGTAGGIYLKNSSLAEVFLSRIFFCGKLRIILIGIVFTVIAYHSYNDNMIVK